MTRALEIVSMVLTFCGSCCEYRNPIDIKLGAVPDDGEQARDRAGKPKVVKWPPT